jgi:hypothetical protein
VRENVPVLSASEIGTYTFCGQAWYLGRRNVARSAAGAENLAKGIARISRLEHVLIAFVPSSVLDDG